MLMYGITKCDVSKILRTFVSALLLTGCASSPSFEHILESSQSVEQKPVSKSCNSGEVLFCDHRKAGARHHCVCASRSFW